MGRLRLDWCIVWGALAAGGAAAQTTWFVDAAAAPPGDGTAASPYASLQYAHDQAATRAGDTLSIAPGTYPEALTFAHGKALRLVGAGTLQTHLSGGLEVLGVPGVTHVEALSFRDAPVTFQQSHVELDDVHVHDVGFTGVVASITVVGADSTWNDVAVFDNPGGGAGVLGGAATMTGCTFANHSGISGGLFASTSTLSLRDCTFLSNDVFNGHGGAMHLASCRTTLVDCHFEDNTAYVDGRLGGAIYVGGGQITITGGTFDFNRSDRGGALALLGEATLNGVTFTDNWAQRDGTSAFLTAQGGAIYVGFAGTLIADGCRFLENQAPPGLPALPDDQVGGAIYALAPGSTVRASLFAENVAGVSGAAVPGPVQLADCIVRENDSVRGAALVGVSLERCTVVANGTGAGVAALVDATVANSIVWGHPHGSLAGTASATYSCIQGGAPGAGNLADPPQFVDLPAGDVGLSMASPCIDAASPSAPLDPDLTPADMGAVPFAWQPMGTSYCSANLNSSGQSARIAALGSPAVGDDFVRLQATHTAAGQLGLFLASQQQGFVPLWGGSQGNLCLSAPIFRLVNTPGSVSSSGAQGLLNLRLGLTTLPAGLTVHPGQTWHFQAWFRDTWGGRPTSNSSDAVSVTFQ